MARANAPWFRVSKGAWYITTADGRKVSLGVKGRGNEKQAVQAWHRLMGGMPLETLPTPQNTPQTLQVFPKPVTSVQAVLNAYLDDCEGRMKAESIRKRRYFLDAFKVSHGAKTAEELTPVHAEAFVRRWGTTTQNDVLGMLQTAFRWGVRAKILTHNPLENLKRPPKRSRGAETILTADEHARLMANASPQFRLFLVVLHATGARPSEIASITAENFDAENALVVLENHKTAHKGKGRVIYLSPEIVALLAAQREKHPEGVLLRNRYGTPWRITALVKTMGEVRLRAGVPHATCYGYRHTFATDALANGVPDAHVAELLGHSGTTMLHKHYAHLGARAKVLREALANVR